MAKRKRASSRSSFASTSRRSKASVKAKDRPREFLPCIRKLIKTAPKNCYFAGIDPGKKGGFAILFPDGKVVTRATPMLKVTGGFKYDTKRMFRMLCTLYRIRSRGGMVRVAIETQQGRPNTAKWAAQVIGEGFGRWLALLELLELSYDVISPSSWKPVYLPKEAHKVASVMASNAVYKTKLKNSQDGMAEAVLIADYGKRKQLGWL